LPRKQIINCVTSDGKRKTFSVTNYGDIATPLEHNNVTSKKHKFSVTNYGDVTTPTDPVNLHLEFTDNKCAKSGVTNNGDAAVLRDNVYELRENSNRESCTHDDVDSPHQRSLDDRESGSHEGVTTLDDDVFRFQIPGMHRKPDECAIYIPESVQDEQTVHCTTDIDLTDKVQRH